MPSPMRLIVLFFLPLLLVSCNMPYVGFRPPPIVMLWDKVPAVPGSDDPLPLTLFKPDKTTMEFNFGPQWSGDAYVDNRSGLAAFNGGPDPLSLDETLRCYDLPSGQELFSMHDGLWIPLGFIEGGWSLVAMKVESSYHPLDDTGAPTVKRGFTGRGYKLKYTVYIIDCLTGKANDGIVLFDSATNLLRWEERIEFRPQLASDAGLLFAALPEMPYTTKEIKTDKRPVKLFALDLRTGESKIIDIDGLVRDRNFSFIVSANAASILFQSQIKGRTVKLRLPNYSFSEREWGDLFIWHEGAVGPVALLDGKHVRHQMGLDMMGDKCLYAEIEYDPEKRLPVEGTLKFYTNNCTGKVAQVLPIHGDVWNISLSPGGRWVGYLVDEREYLHLRLYDTLNLTDTLLAECGPHSRFYGFAGAGRGDIAVPYADRMLFGFPNPTLQ
jgi:hypothetical protein